MAAPKPRRGKAKRANYKDMDGVDYASIRQSDWYTSVERDEEIEDSNFWCMEQLFIYKDIYATMAYPVRPMHPLDLQYLKSKDCFSEAMFVTEQMGLHHLMGIQCDYSIPLVQQFFATLVIKGDDVHTLKWMTG